MEIDARRRIRLKATHRQVGGSHYLEPGGSWDVPTLDHLARAAARAAPRSLTVADRTPRLTAAQVESRVASLAGAMRAAGVRRGDSVAWQLPNCVEAYLLYRACWRLGAVAVPVHHQVGPTESARMAEQIGPVVAFSVPGAPLHERPKALTARAGDDQWEALLTSAPIISAAARPFDVAVALFTSGSTGEPKAVLHTHRALSYKAKVMAGAHGLEATDAVLMPAPLAHISGLLNGVVLPMSVGMLSVLMEKFDPEQATELVASEKISFMIGPPAIFTAMMATPQFETSKMSSMRIISSGSMGITPEFVDDTRRAFDATVKRTYGSTEAPTVSTSTWRDPVEKARDTDGRAVGEAELRVVVPGSGRAVPAHHAGELLLRGPELFAGYADAAQTAASMHRGWFRTGDLATLDDAGWLTIVGRIKELIIRGGENIAPAEVERVIESHPAVRQAVAVGCPDERLGERVVAYVIVDSPFNLEDCRQWFRQQGMSTFKTPERVVRVDELPLLSLGKPDRSALRARAAADGPISTG